MTTTQSPAEVDKHRQRHVLLHQSLDELVADWIGHEQGLPSKASVLDLIKWSHEQTKNPTETP